MLSWNKKANQSRYTYVNNLIRSNLFKFLVRYKRYSSSYFITIVCISDELTRLLNRFYNRLGNYSSTPLTTLSWKMTEMFSSFSRFFQENNNNFTNVLSVNVQFFQFGLIILMKVKMIATKNMVCGLH